MHIWFDPSSAQDGWPSQQRSSPIQQFDCADQHLLGRLDTTFYQSQCLVCMMLLQFSPTQTIDYIVLCNRTVRVCLVVIVRRIPPFSLKRQSNPCNVQQRDHTVNSQVSCWPGKTAKCRISRARFNGRSGILLTVSVAWNIVVVVFNIATGVPRRILIRSALELIGNTQVIVTPSLGRKSHNLCTELCRCFQYTLHLLLGWSIVFWLSRFGHPWRPNQPRARRDRHHHRWDSLATFQGWRNQQSLFQLQSRFLPSSPCSGKYSTVFSSCGLQCCNCRCSKFPYS